MKIAYLPASLALLFWASSGHGLDLLCGSKETIRDCRVSEQQAVWPHVSIENDNRTYYSVSFTSLDTAIAHYRALAQSQSWPPLKGRFLIREGKAHPQVALIRDRLRILGDYSYDHPLSNQHFFDSRMSAAVMAFQRRHGLKVDGIVGPNTRQAMNVSPRERWHQLLVNKQRELVDRVAERPDYIEINIPDYQLRYFRNGEVVSQMRVIVGKKERPTPVMNSILNALEVNPDWNVPKRIAYEDILPKLEGEREAFDKLGVKLVKGWYGEPNVVAVEELDMSKFYRGDLAEQLRFWQPPGVSNPLGQLKFIFPNDFSIYMHGTPVKHLFDEPQRSFSSGCIRIEDPMGLARLLLENSTQPPIDLDAELETEAASVSGLPGDVEIFTRYRTAWIDHGSGVLQFRADIYKRDPNELAQLTATQQGESSDTATN